MSGTPRVAAPLRLAHRGDHRAAPENTLAACRAALALPGVDGLEFDVRLAADGVPILLHDETLARVQGRPESAAALTAVELARHGIPTLAELLAVAPAPAFLDVELKEDCGAAAVEVLEHARGASLERAVVSSFEPAALETVRRLRPAWGCWLNVEDLAPATVAAAVALGCRGVSAERVAIDAASAARVRAAGLELAAWTVVGHAEWDRLAALGVAAICVEREALSSRGTPRGAAG